MDFSYNDDQTMLADILGRYLRQHYAIDTRHMISGSAAGWSAEHWASLGDMGIIGALFSQSVGGFGGGGFDIAVVFEQIGRALVVEPLLGTLMAGRALAKAGGQEGLLETVISGNAILAFAHEEPQSRYNLADISTRAKHVGDNWTLTGAKAVVPQVEASDHILVSARIAGEEDAQAGIGLFLVDRSTAGLGLRGYPMIDGGRGGEVLLDGAKAMIVSEESYSLIEEATAAGIVALAWEAIGLMDQLKAQTLEYLRTRKQFGVPIGKFQALQHRMATVAMEIKQARSAAINAAAALDGDRLTRERAVSAAKYTIGRVGTLVAEESIQLHGGIGMTWELPLSHYAKRLTMIGHMLGDEDHHLARYIDLGRAA